MFSAMVFVDILVRRRLLRGHNAPVIGEGGMKMRPFTMDISAEPFSDVLYCIRFNQRTFGQIFLSLRIKDDYLILCGNQAHSFYDIMIKCWRPVTAAGK